MDKVYLVKSGFRYEGSSVVFVASTHEKAEEYIEATFSRRGEKLDTKYYYRDPTIKDYWLDYVEIEEWKVDVNCDRPYCA